MELLRMRRPARWAPLAVLLLWGCAPTPTGDEEICHDGIDNDGDGATDEGEDADGDGALSCDLPELADCNDTDPTVQTASVEVCDGADNDCDGSVDEDFDADGDGFTTCGADGDPATTDDNDCDDTPAGDAVHPGAAELCDELDNDCDGIVDRGSRAVRLSGFPDHLAVPGFAPGVAMTVEAWVYLEDLTLQHLVHKLHDNGNLEFALFLNDVPEWQATVLREELAHTAGVAAAAGTWTHVAFTADGAQQHLFLNGLLQASTDDATALRIDPAAPWTLGAHEENGDVTRHVVGLVDEVRIWSVARTAEEIEATRCRPLTGTEDDLELYLPFEEDFLDHSANGRDATATGDPVLEML